MRKVKAPYGRRGAPDLGQGGQGVNYVGEVDEALRKAELPKEEEVLQNVARVARVSIMSVKLVKP